MKNVLESDLHHPYLTFQCLQPDSLIPEDGHDVCLDGLLRLLERRRVQWHLTVFVPWIVMCSATMQGVG